MNEFEENKTGKSAFIYLPVEKIKNHPDNPRDGLGDLTELADSIRENGVMQNLTVVPDGENYLAVIGNRRLAAARLAGIETVPCVIREDMDYKTQIMTMLTENMQRKDLTLYAQAEQIQMAIDLGEDVKSICRKTGLSETTIGKRQKLAKLEREGFKKAVENGATLMDLEKTAKIEDKKERKKILDAFGTNDFKWMMESELNRQASEKVMAEIINYIKKTETMIGEEDTEGKIFVDNIIGLNGKETVEERIEESKRHGKGPFYYLICHDEERMTTWVKVFGEPDDGQEEKKNRKKREDEEREAHRRKLSELATTAAKLRKDFIVKTPEYDCKHGMDKIMAGLAKGLDTMQSYYLGLYDLKPEKMQNVFDQWMPDQKGWTGAVDIYPCRSALIVVWIVMEDRAGSRGLESAFIDNKGNHKENKEMMELYDWMESLGYEPAEEERSLIDGSCELYKEKEDYEKQRKIFR